MESIIITLLILGVALVIYFYYTDPELKKPPEDSGKEEDNPLRSVAINYYPPGKGNHVPENRRYCLSGYNGKGSIDFDVFYSTEGEGQQEVKKWNDMIRSGIEVKADQVRHYYDWD